MSQFHSVGKVADYPDPSSSFVEVDEEPIVLIRAAGSFYALDDVCTHDGGPLSDGPLTTEDIESAIACPRHGAKFSLSTGAALTMPATQATRSHEVKIEDGEVLVRLCD